MHPLRAKFINDLRLRSYSERTVENYVYAVSSLASHYRRAPLSLTSSEIRGYLLWLVTERKFAPATVNLHMDALKTFYRAMAPGCTVMEGVKHVKRGRHIPVVLSRQEVLRIIDATANVRDRAIISLLYCSGVRLSECINLKLAHIESQRMKVRVECGKGKRDRYTLLSQTTLEHLRAYARECRPSVWLFEGQAGGRISKRSVGRIVVDAARRAGINKQVHPHTLRHCFGTHLLEAGVPLPAIQMLLGHASITTTMIYLHLSNGSLECIRSPLDMPCDATGAAADAMPTLERAHAR